MVKTRKDYQMSVAETRDTLTWLEEDFRKYIKRLLLWILYLLRAEGQNDAATEASQGSLLIVNFFHSHLLRGEEIERESVCLAVSSRLISELFHRLNDPR